MTNAHDIIAGVLQDPPMYSSKVARHILAALRDAAGASATDSITIAADGTVGRLTEMLVKFDPHYQLRCFHTPQASCAINTHEVFYRVVTP